MPALIQYDSPPSLPIPLLPFSFYSFLTVGLAHLANSALGAGREMDPPPRGGDPSPFLPRSVDSGAGRPNWKEPACFLRPGRAGQNGGGPTGPFGPDPAGQKGGDQLAKLLGKIGPKKLVPKSSQPPFQPPPSEQ